MGLLAHFESRQEIPPKTDRLIVFFIKRQPGSMVDQTAWVARAASRLPCYCLAGIHPLADKRAFTEPGWRGNQGKWMTQAAIQSLEQARAQHQVGPGGREA